MFAYLLHELNSVCVCVCMRVCYDITVWLPCEAVNLSFLLRLPTTSQSRMCSVNNVYHCMQMSSWAAAASTKVPFTPCVVFQQHFESDTPDYKFTLGLCVPLHCHSDFTIVPSFTNRAQFSELLLGLWPIPPHINVMFPPWRPTPSKRQAGFISSVFHLLFPLLVTFYPLTFYCYRSQQEEVRRRFVTGARFLTTEV